MSSKHIKDMDLNEACWHVLESSPDSLAECIQLTNDLVKFHSESAHKIMIDFLDQSGIDSPRQINILCNIKFVYMNYLDQRKPGWVAQFVFEDDLAKSYGTFMLPVGHPSIKASWVLLAVVFDENLEPLSTMASNGIRVFKNG